jgi:hypothetical protein
MFVRLVVLCGLVAALAVCAGCQIPATAQASQKMIFGDSSSFFNRPIALPDEQH